MLYWWCCTGDAVLVLMLYFYRCSHNAVRVMINWWWCCIGDPVLLVMLYLVMLCWWCCTRDAHWRLCTGDGIWWWSTGDVVLIKLYWRCWTDDAVMVMQYWWCCTGDAVLVMLFLFVMQWGYRLSSAVILLHWLCAVIMLQSAAIYSSDYMHDKILQSSRSHHAVIIYSALCSKF